MVMDWNQALLSNCLTVLMHESFTDGVISKIMQNIAVGYVTTPDIQFSKLWINGFGLIVFQVYWAAIPPNLTG